LEQLDMKIDPAQLDSYIEDRKNVFGDPSRFGLAVLVAFIHNPSAVTIEYVLRRQHDLGLSLSEKEIRSILSDWQEKGYVQKRPEGYFATQRMLDALEKDGITEEKLDTMADALYSE